MRPLIVAHPSRIFQFKLVNKLLKQKSMIVDLGCGSGITTKVLDNGKREVIGIELEQVYTRFFKKLQSKHLLFCYGDALKTPLKESSVEAVILSSVLQMVKEYETLLNECNRILKEDGVLILSVPVVDLTKNLFKNKIFLVFNKIIRGNETYKEFFKKYYNNKRILTERDIVALLKKTGFKIKEEYYCPGRSVQYINAFLNYVGKVKGMERMIYITLVFYPLLYILNLLDTAFSKKGCELIITAKKK